MDAPGYLGFTSREVKGGTRAIFISPDDGGPPDTVNSYREGPFPEDEPSESAMNHNYIVLGKSRG